MSSILSLIGRENELFSNDIKVHEKELSKIVSNSRFLVIGAAGSIGQAVTKEIFKRKPLKLHVVDISENNMVELVRDIRSSFGYIKGDFQTFALDIGSIEYDAFIKSDGKYDYILNLSALKHVRSEKDPFTLMRMIDVNIFNTEKTLLQSAAKGAKKYFCVSTDKAANPANMMGASKRIMEMFLMRRSADITISTARFANVAFSDGSLLHGFNQRFAKQQPISAPNDVRRYFVTPEESGQLCLLSALLGENRDIFFPKLGFEPVECSSEEEARRSIDRLIGAKKWPVYFFSSNTTGEKDFEEFYTAEENLDLDRFSSIGVISNSPKYDNALLENFENAITSYLLKGEWNKAEIVDLFHMTIPSLNHNDTGQYLDNRM